MPGEARPVTYATFVARAQALKPGTKRDDIVTALGLPDEEGPTFLRYSLSTLAHMPPVGTTVYYAAEIDLKDGRMVGAVKWAWMDTTGPG